ncbi:AcrR family transcriptional regulator [Streptomyces aurantiacus]|uniref:TetR/AcrR family transcriptional regulator n=1 Tax=Streptomyces aurantiacus TaxID=47760 RepID=UPI0027940102|nr:TetR/AcrR family transcriptional regulator [Streptomyces aurantiacus]MDQ0779294.1 AcrR family transcriptional regulator [Streptomyces aurantiacus]
MTEADQPRAARPPAHRTRRADAERNRSAIIEAAGAVFAEQGSAVDVREIARLSGVGMGTLYRHFPTKDDLFTTVVEREFTAWLTEGHRAAAATEDPWRALTGFFEHTLTHQARNRALVESYVATGGPTVECARRCDCFLADLHARCLGAGVLRADVTSADLVLLLISLSQVVQTSNDGRFGQWRRLLHISLDGMSSRHTDPLPDVSE